MREARIVNGKIEVRIKALKYALMAAAIPSLRESPHYQRCDGTSVSLSAGKYEASSNARGLQGVWH